MYCSIKYNLLNKIKLDKAKVRPIPTPNSPHSTPPTAVRAAEPGFSPGEG